MDEPERLARRLRTALTSVFAGLVVALISERLGYAGLYRGEATGIAILVQVALGLPSIVYLAALWQLRSVTVDVANGRAFAPSASRGLRACGALLLAGSALSLIAAVGWGEKRLIEADVSTLIIAAIGLALLLIARLFDQARAIKTELDEIF